jgi:tRNA threonylcarbamoyladenosine biosynthesis protein TsaE
MLQGMNILQKTLHTSSPEQTMRIAKVIGSNLRGGEVIELVSDIGGGKTTFVRGLAKGVGSRNHVSSPTFTVGQIYTSANKKIYHYDLYRLSDAGLMQHEVQEALQDPSGILIVEWAQSIQSILPKNTITLHISYHEDDVDGRILNFRIPKQHEYVLLNMEAAL